MGGGLFAYATSASPGCASWTAAQQTLLSRPPRNVSVVVVVASAAASDGEAAAERQTELAAGGRPGLAGQPRQLRQGPEEVALGGSRSGEQPGLRGSEPVVSVRSARCEAMRVSGWRPGLCPLLGVHAARLCLRGRLGRGCWAVAGVGEGELAES